MVTKQSSGLTPPSTTLHPAPTAGRSHSNSSLSFTTASAFWPLHSSTCQSAGNVNDHRRSSPAVMPCMFWGGGAVGVIVWWVWRWLQVRTLVQHHHSSAAKRLAPSTLTPHPQHSHTHTATLTAARPRGSASVSSANRCLSSPGKGTSLPSGVMRMSMMETSPAARPLGGVGVRGGCWGVGWVCGVWGVGVGVAVRGRVQNGWFRLEQHYPQPKPSWAGVESSDRRKHTQQHSAAPTAQPTCRWQRAASPSPSCTDGSTHQPPPRH